MGLDPTALTAVDSAPDVYPPLAGTAVLSSDVASGEQALLDRTEHAFNGGPTDYVEDRSLLFVWHGLTDAASTDYWGFGNTGQPVQTGPGAAIVLYVHLELPHGGELTGVALNIDPAAHGAAPGTFPTVALYRVALATGTRTQIGSTTTDVWNGGAYDTPHPLSITGLSHTIDRDLYRYVLEFTGEAGANYAAGLAVIGPTCTGNFRRLLSPGS